ncbi:3-dehydroquinate synthase [Beggiatoa leptomitoformis]|uniref:3-dehydroquinate synthase n=1 Tax=Beggiatoa leptomitoformis TaxID=288004 RepID=A0A2N9YD93_9GAMM|nr:3-dehydroquinate synthase [Beggiatoa leptomitoformis]ALG69136.1 3-dehydroquinate synthase [Beggiatoa leptomitoformis]AUI68447.1 3-dehydroquinate synthase [Beggiatoa leptomitoformis]
MKTVTVNLGERSYPIFIGQNLLGNPELIQPYVQGKQVMIVSNETVSPLYLEKILPAFQGLNIEAVILPDGEQYKTLDVLNQVFDGLLSEKFDRQATLVALGGGVVGDMTGFAAACYQRGVNFIQIPTTLLAQVDSSVGGKTGVNHALGKNMIGAFHQPQCVVIDTDTLNTLPDRELSAGFAEVIKYGLIDDIAFLQWLENNVTLLLKRDADALNYAIARSCQSKARIVSLDEKESGVRALLNLGHTFGHAIETSMGYGTYLHGEAIAIGMVLAARLSATMGWLSNEDVVRVARLIKRFQLPTTIPANMTPADMWQRMQVDKKVRDGKVRLVLMQKLGLSLLTDQYDPALLQKTLQVGQQEIAT